MPVPVRLVLVGLLLAGCSSPTQHPDTGMPPTAPAIVATPPSPYLHLPYRSRHYRIDEVDKPVLPIRGPMPAYPIALTADGVEGMVRLRFVVTAAGVVDSGSVEVVQASRSEFSAPAITAIREWQFQPAEIRGMPVPQVVEQNVRFSLGERR